MNIKNDLGFILLDLQMSPGCNNIMKQISNIIEHNPYKQVCIFNNYCERFDNYNVPILPLSHAKFFDGDLFLVDSVSLILSKDFPLAKRKYLYLSNPIWRDGYNAYSLWQTLLNQDNLNYIATNKELADLIDLCWNKKASIVKNFNSMEIINALQ